MQGAMIVYMYTTYIRDERDFNVIFGVFRRTYAVCKIRKSVDGGGRIVLM